MKSSKNKFESMSKFNQISKEQLGFVSGGIAAAGAAIARTTLTCIHTTGCCKCTDADDID